MWGWPMRPAILIIDDDPAIVDSLAILLERNGYTVAFAESGSHGLEMVEPGRFGVILSDMNMPGLHGVELIASIRRIDPDVAIVAMSGSLQGAVDSSLEGALLAGANHLLDKPFDAAELLGAIASLARQSPRE